MFPKAEKSVLEMSLEVCEFSFDRAKAVLDTMGDRYVAGRGEGGEFLFLHNFVTNLISHTFYVSVDQVIKLPKMEDILAVSFE